ncbi:hypothetical protein LQ567_05195 [Niabella pedocola]|uniref:Uncharacterized protein n=1 Tax=Niabella pedocola TaxID=1752077 RepID=A0ABS8PM27_9BACT|nr:hypothetical protein [Niabella pedocola]MCD2422148.1 hypothetical protein [Niabella pedocola]
MNTEIQVAFLKRKITAFDTALFYDQSDQVLQCPTSFIKAFYFDAQDNICFLVERPYVDINGMKAPFAARLHFHKKGMLWSIDLSGTAAIAPHTNAPLHKVLIRFRIAQATCFHARRHCSSAIADLRQRIGYFVRKLYQDVPDHLEMALE